MLVETLTTLETLETCIRNRASVRAFTSEPIPMATLKECLLLAQRSASNSNIQNWRLTIASGAARDRIVAALQKASSERELKLPPLPGPFAPLRNELVQQLYGAEGYDVMGEVKREARQSARMRNFEFFGAPTCAVITMDERLGMVDAMGVGLFVQTFTLALTARGLGSCLQVSVTGYPDVLQEGFKLAEGEAILCGMAIGWAADDKINSINTHRNHLDTQVRFLEV